MTAEQVSVKVRTPVDHFIKQLEQLGKGPRAILRRHAGNLLSESSSVYSLFFRMYPKDQTWYDQDIYFLVATLFPLNQHELTGDLGDTLRSVRIRSDSSSLDRRMAILLDSDFDRSEGRDGGGTLSFRLRQLIRLADSQGVGVDWRRLLADLLFWSHPEKRVQQRWAQSYYSGWESGEKDAIDSNSGVGGQPHVN